MNNRNYLRTLTVLLKKRHWNSSMLWKMLDLIVKDLLEKEDHDLTYSVFREIYLYARKCKSLAELEDYLDKFSY